MYATKIYRISNFLYNNKLKLLSKVFYALNNILNNCDIYPSTKIGRNSLFSHGGIATVINKKAIIGENVIICQNVTIGGSMGKRPIIGNNVYIAPGAKVLGGVLIEDYVIIGANAVVIKDVKKYSIVGGVPAKNIGFLNEENFDKYSDAFPFSLNPFLCE